MPSSSNSNSTHVYTLVLLGGSLAAVAAWLYLRRPQNGAKKERKSATVAKPQEVTMAAPPAAAVVTGSEGKATTTVVESSPGDKPVLEPGVWHSFKLIEKEHLTVNVPCPVLRFRFALPTPDSVLGLPTGQHISLRCTNPQTQKPHMRSYTPTSSNDDKGFIDLVVKVYPTGVLGQHLTHLPIGGTIDISGPKGRFTYEPNKFSHICMLAGGSGITPMYQIAREIIKNRSTDRTQAHLIFGNVTEEDIIMRRELEEMAEKYPEKFTVYHVLNNPPEEWLHGKGFITADHIGKQFPAASTPDVKVLLCGPPPMMQAMKGNLTTLGFQPEQIFQF